MVLLQALYIDSPPFPPFFSPPPAAHCTCSSAFDVMSPFTGFSILTLFLHQPYNAQVPSACGIAAIFVYLPHTGLGGLTLLSELCISLTYLFTSFPRDVLAVGLMATTMSQWLTPRALLFSVFSLCL